MHKLHGNQNWNPFPPTEAVADAEHRSAANRAIGFSAIGLFITGAVELTVAVLSGSVGLLGDALHNLSDVSTSLAVFVGFRFSCRHATSDHTYGYDRAEDLAGLGVALAIWASAIFAGIVSVHKLTEHGRTSHLAFGMVAAGVGIVGNQIVARYKGAVGRKIQSATLVADARHSWLDAISSLGALVGLIFVAFGYRLGDPIAGFAITLFIAHVGYEVTSDIVSNLMDGVEPEQLDHAQAAAANVSGVLSAAVRGRWTGRSLRLEVVSEVEPEMSVGATQDLAQQIRAEVLASVGEARVVDVWFQAHDAHKR